MDVSAYLTGELDAVLQPILRQLVRERPTGSAAIASAIARLADEERAVANTKCLRNIFQSGDVSQDRTPLAMSADDVTAAWLSKAIGCPVKSMKTRLCSEGQVGITIVITDVVYENGANSASLPTSMALKMHGPSADQRAVMAQAGLLHKEIHMYSEVFGKGSWPMLTPKVLGIWYDPKHGYEQLQLFNLLMENLNDNYTPYDTAVSPPPRADWDELYRELAKLHAKFWRDPNIAAPPFAPDKSGVFKMAEGDEAVILGYGAVVKPWEDALDKYMRQHVADWESDMEPILKICRKWEGEASQKYYRAAMKRLTTAPCTMVHGDFNPGNVWKGTARGEMAGSYCTADWQLTRMAPCAWDFITAMIGFDEKSGTHVIDVLKAYHTELTRLLDPSAAKAYPYELFEDHVKCMYVIFWQWAFVLLYVSMVQATDSGALDPAKAKYTWSVYLPNNFRRMSKCVIDLGLAAWQEELVAGV